MADLIDLNYVCKEVVGRLLKEKQVGVKVEGVRLSRAGRVAIIQIYTENGAKYLFDITAMGKEGFKEGGLQALFESTSVVKVLFDSRVCNDAFHHLFGFTMDNVLDLQVLHALKFKTEGDGYVDDISKCLRSTGLLADQEWKSFEHFQKKGKRMVETERGGDDLRWEERPVHPDVLRYFASDCKWYLAMKQKWNSPDLERVAKQRSRERIWKTIARDKCPKALHLALLDFPLMPKVAVGEARSTPQKCSLCLQDLYGDVRPLLCGHAFHDECIRKHNCAVDQCKSGAPSCPVCREQSPEFEPLSPLTKKCALNPCRKVKAYSPLARQLTPLMPIDSHQPPGCRKAYRDLAAPGYCIAFCT
jgi:hypothetical protein